MLIDARSVDGGSAFECDLCVVGSGPAGIAIADRLRDSGLNLMLLEAGGQDYELPAQKLYRGQIVGRPYYRLDACRWRMFGGGTNRWGGWCRPLDRADYAERAWLALSGWPISAESLQVYEEAAATLFELPSPRFDLDAWRDRMPSPLALDGTNFENGLIQHSPETNFADRYGPRLIAAWLTLLYKFCNLQSFFRINHLIHAAPEPKPKAIRRMPRNPQPSATIDSIRIKGRMNCCGA